MPRGSRRSRHASLQCPYAGCPQRFKSESGRTNHVRSKHLPREKHQRHTSPSPPCAQTPSPIHSPRLSPQIPLSPSSERPITPDEAQDQAHADIDNDHRRRRVFQPFLNAKPTTKEGDFLPPNQAASHNLPTPAHDWSPFEDEIQFKIADFLYRTEEMSQSKINYLLELWAFTLMKHGSNAPFDNYQHIYDLIDKIEAGDAPWNCFKASLNDQDNPNAPSWQKAEYDIWYRDPKVVMRNMLSNPDFAREFDTTPYIELKDGKRRRSDFMSANFAWRQCDILHNENPEQNDGAMFVPIILGSDKTTVTIATGDIEYHPLYLSIGNIHNRVRRAHCNGVVPIGFLAIPKSERKHDNDVNFRKFKRQLYHSTISAILQPLKPAMSSPEVYLCPDGHYRRVLFGIGPFIADYPEQVMLAGIKQGWCPRCTALPDDMDGMAGPRHHELTDALLAEFSPAILWDEYGIDAEIIPFTRDFPRADIHELLSSDLLHQAIKGTFKDHLVEWVGIYLRLAHEPAEADQILDQIDRRIAATPPFPNLRRFKQGRRFKQWTGDNSKALMKVYLPAIHGLVPPDIVKCIAAFLDFCYLARRSDFDTTTLEELDAALHRFHTHREVFRTSGVRENGFSLPQQHSLVHYRKCIEDFGAPNGLCSSITESRHITAVKKPWRRSNRFEALGQMLIINQRLDKLTAARSLFISKGMLPIEHGPPTGAEYDDDDDGGPVDEDRVIADVSLARTKAKGYPSGVYQLADYLEFPAFPSLLHAFLKDQISGFGENISVTSMESEDEEEHSLSHLSPISVYHSAVASFYAPSDPSGLISLFGIVTTKFFTP